MVKNNHSVIYKSLLAIAILTGTLYVPNGNEANARQIGSGYREIALAGDFSPPSEGKFDLPTDVALDAEGNVYVADQYNDRIQKFDSNGQFLLMWGDSGSGDGQFDETEEIEVDGDGNVYVLDQSNSRVQVFDENGSYLRQWGSYGGGDGLFLNPTGLAVDAAGAVYVLDSGKSNIQKFDADGVFLSKWGSLGNGSGQFQNPEGIDVDASGNVYVIDQHNHRVSVFGAAGNFIRQWGTSGNGNGQFYYANGITVGNDGHVYVADTNNHRIQEFDANGAFLGAWGEDGSGDGQFRYPWGIVTDAAGNVYVADSNNNRIQKFDADGVYASKWGSFGEADLSADNGALDDEGNLYITDSSSQSVLKFDAEGHHLPGWGGYGSDPGRFIYPGDVDIDDDGNVYVSDSGNNRIQKFDASGNFLSQWGSSGTGDGQFQNPGAIALGGDGILYVVDEENSRIQKFDQGGVYAAQWAIEIGDDWEEYNEVNLAADDSGNVYALFGDTGLIQKFDSDGELLAQWGGRGMDQGSFIEPRGISLDADGHLYVADYYNNRIQKFDSNGMFLTQWGGGEASSEGIAYPEKVLPRDDGRMVVLQSWDESNSISVHVYSPDDIADAAVIALSQGTLSPSFAPDFEGPYQATVGANTAEINLTIRLANPGASAQVRISSGWVEGEKSDGVFSYSVPLTVGANPITVRVTATEDEPSRTYTVDVTRAEPVWTGNDGGGTLPPQNPSDGKLMLKAGQSGEESLDDEIRVMIPAGATRRALELAIERKNEPQAPEGQALLSRSVYKIRKNFAEKFDLPVVIDMAFNPKRLESGQRPGIFYYEEAARRWTEVAGSKAEGNRIQASVDDVAAFAVFAVDGETAGPDIKLSDIAGHWAESDIRQAVLNGIAQGYDDGTFRPDATIGRAEFMVMLMNAIKRQAELPALGFADETAIPEWAKAAIAEAAALGIIEGYEDGTFRPDAAITRAEMAVLIARAMELTLGNDGATDFADDNDIPSWAKSAAAMLKERGLMLGKGQNRFAPNDNATRAEAVTILLRLP
ncbi:S-layer homology domain-containing protein [Paenibacillus sp. LHD-117]|uniref:S-layer homology domain-containing protein n=1 Tax=Paenibacillus sp. LHD-117 TaxID=3071412 RepID=UPI0027E0E917|nr:S-layer homology domain-containing protein [Paenibacillus sp. LHD-117]MDQ6423534.1 S-layer homology domain-containing protein [Paenibacillus sp. LHD-117]